MYFYNAEGALSSSVDARAGKRYYYTYDVNGNITELLVTGLSGVTAPEYRVSFAYDEENRAGRTELVFYAANGAEIRSFVCASEYDADGAVTGFTYT